MSYALFRVGKVWHYRFQIDDDRRQRSTRETVRRRAEEIAQKAYDDAKLWARGKDPVPTLKELVEEWLIVHAKTASEAHLKSVETFGRLHTYQLGAMRICDITTAEVELARGHHLGTHVPASANHWLSVLKLVVNWAVARKVIPMLPWKVKMLKVQKRPRTMLPMTSAKAWLAAVDRATSDSPNIATAIRLMFGLGLRESEAAGARWEWIDWERQTYTPGKTKGREAEPIPIPNWLIDHLRSHAFGIDISFGAVPGATGYKVYRGTTAGGENVLCGVGTATSFVDKRSGLIAPGRGGIQLAPGYARRAMRSANKECGIDGLTPHRLRGTFATMLSEAGVPIQTIQKVMRHKDPMTTMKYLEKNLAIAAQAQEQIAEKMGLPTHTELAEKQESSGEKVASSIVQSAP